MSKAAKLQRDVRKRKIAASFGASVDTYNAASSVQKDVADMLLDLLAMQKLTATKQIIDLGSGLDYCANLLELAFPDSDILSCDISLPMLHSARAGRANSKTRRWICADMDALPFQRTVDLMVSNLCVQWSDDLAHTLEQVQGTLRHDGVMVFSTMLDGSLHELKSAWAQVDSYHHVNQFLTEDEVKRAVLSSGLELLHFEYKERVQSFDSLKSAIKSLKNIGANVKNGLQKKGLMGRDSFTRLQQHYPVETSSTLKTKKYPLSYRIGLYVCKKPSDLVRPPSN